jgi:hypothetical protein
MEQDIIYIDRDLFESEQPYKLKANNKIKFHCADCLNILPSLEN